ncbi:alkaline phosphatase D family protein [Neolewinella lacunae]|uniref:Alkaline phosphatase family protein n=1 Tax=Neolewinella lacunae TaxID=1517758 RepID=A0A923PRM9_9BACT|nr:alkaline phosphatase D family protein [Neolewinella lacunae]MBC6996213.1 alkaline phosphatase family protein [Neolewinella lacunae]MDN3637170.1 alkaline phosphatase D family protein [Neolewinella lacunae]
MRIFIPLLLCFLLVGCQRSGPTLAAPTTFKIAFGSCAHQDKPQPLLDVATGLSPDVFVYLGDNIYGDSYTLDTLRAKYGRLAAKPEFQRLKASTPLLAVWDDHDYGWNDAGRHFPFKEASKEIFLDFWEVPATSERRQHPGIYGTEWLERDGRKVQIILLDTRTFRDELLHRDKSDTVFKNDYVPNFSADSTFLGAAQWTWLEAQLKMPADARIIASSNQFSHEYNGWESWTNVPREQQRMLDLIRSTKANGIFFISGDVHWGEISRMESAGLYPIYDVTSSGITQTWDIIEPNKYRRGKAIAQNNVGMITLTFKGNEGQAQLSIFDATALPVVTEGVDINQLRVK